MSQRRRTVGISEEPIKTPATGHAGTLAWARVEAGPLDAIYVAFTDAGIRRIDFDRPDEVGTLAAAPAWLERPLAAYFRSEPIDLGTLPIDPAGTEFQKRVWAELRTIPWGHVATYGHVARRIGSPRGMRAVGMANGHNPIPIVVPCHRVVEAGGKLGGYSGGLDKKRALLAIERVVVEGGRVLPGQLDLFGPAAA